MRFVVLILSGIFLMGGCGYSIKMVSVEEDRLQSEHRKTLEENVAQLQEEAKLLRRGGEENRAAVSDLQKRRANADARLDETTLTIQMIQGKLEKDDHRRSELSRQTDDNTFRLNELAQIKNRLTEEEKRSDAVQKTLQAQIDGLKGVSGGLQKSLEAVGTRAAATSEEQEKRMKELSSLLSELSQKIPPLLNTQSAQLDELGRQFQRLSQGGNVEELSKELMNLSKALDLLGQKITTKVDEQDRILRGTRKRLEALEEKLAPKGKRSAQAPESDQPEPGRPIAATDQGRAVE